MNVAFGIVKSYDEQTGIGIVQSCAMDADDVIFVLDTASGIKFEPGQRIRFDYGKRAINLRPDNSHIESETRL
jgi:cold shock CspA family protein